MIDSYVNNPKSIKFHVKKYLHENAASIKDKIVLDIPAGNGATTELLKEIGAKVEAFDLFPEYFMLKNIECKRADIMDRIPVSDNYADFLICQEGIEHFSDQIKVLQEFNRVLKPGGKLLITTPSQSDLASKFSHLLYESESTTRFPPNEIDDVWMSEKSITNEVYYGHIFLIGLQKLRVLGKLCGFDIDEIRFVRTSKRSVFLLPFFYPFIAYHSISAYRRNLKNKKDVPMEIKKSVYKEQMRINLSIKNLINKHQFVVLQKNCDLDKLDFNHRSVNKKFDHIM